MSLTGGEARRLTLAGSLCRAPAAIVSVRGMEDPAIPHCHRHDQGLWGIQRKPAAFLGSPAFSLPERPGDGLSKLRPQIHGSVPLPLFLIETLSPIEKSLQGFLGSLTPG